MDSQITVAGVLLLSSVVRLAVVLLVFIVFPLRFPHFSCTIFSINTLRFSHNFALVRHSSPALSRFHDMQYINKLNKSEIASYVDHY